MLTLASLQLQPEIARITAAASQDDGQPRWAGLFAEVLESLPIEAATANRVGLEAETPVAFEGILRPFLATGLKKLTAQHPAGLAHLDEAARHSLERQLLQNLSALAGRSLWLEFSLFQRQGTFFLANPVEAIGEAPRKNYDRFVEKLAIRPNFLAFFADYPVLARLLTICLQNWLAVTTLFLDRLAADWASLEQTFGGNFRQVTQLKPGLSDPHVGGQQVLALTFDDKISLVYKPRNLAAECGFQSLLDWCGSRLNFDLGRLKMFIRPAYGWVEFVRPEPCQDTAQVANYYRRAGALLGLLYGLRGNDFHYQNVIARGEYAFLIDLEGLFYPAASSGENEFTVLHTGLLPTWQVVSGGAKYDQSGLYGQAHPSGEKNEWQFVNTDRMQSAPARNAAAETETKIAEWPHRPFLQGTNQPGQPSIYREDLITGFREVCVLLSAERENLLAEDGPLAIFKSVAVRFVFRPTQVYADLLKMHSEPKYLRSEAARRQLFTRLGRILETSGEASRWRPLVQAEIASLDQLDVPHFTVKAGSLDLTLPDGTQAERFFKVSGYRLACDQLANLDPAAVERQLNYLQAALYSYEAGRVKLDNFFQPGTAFEPEAALAAAGRIARILREQAVSGPEGLSWARMDNSQPAKFYQPAGFDFSLYRGQGGIALFLAAYASQTAQGEYRQLALDAWQPLLEKLGRGELNSAELNGLGGGLGAGSVVYSLTACATLLNAAELLKAAEQLAGWAFADSLLAQDRSYDVIGGTAGALLGLLALYRQKPSPQLAERLAACGQLLLDRRSGLEGSRSWETLEGKRWSGFSHGAAGIAYALLGLYRFQPLPAYREAAGEAFAFENTLYQPAVGNWLGYPGQAGNAEGLWNTWCHGAPGTGLARLAALQMLSDSEQQLKGHIEAALETTLNQPLAGLDHLCCGNFGRFDFLIEAAARLQRPELLAAAREKAAVLLARPGGFVLSEPRPLHLTGPGFFQGLSGIGYELLRLVEPGQLKSVLLWA